jgi:glutamate-1-semialdehyde 2,1-aminomutase
MIQSQSDRSSYSSGIPAGLRGLVIVLPYNNFELLETTVRARWGEITAIIVEPIAGNMTSILPAEGWLEHIRKLCDDYGIVMIMDEVKTGFRISKGGATEYFGVQGDLMTYAKSLANGFPLAAVGGREEVMNVIEIRCAGHVRFSEWEIAASQEFQGCACFR